jgi:hypothetical protein
MLGIELQFQGMGNDSTLGTGRILGIGQWFSAAAGRDSGLFSEDSSAVDCWDYGVWGGGADFSAAKTHDFAGLITVGGFLVAFILSKLGG